MSDTPAPTTKKVTIRRAVAYDIVNIGRLMEEAHRLSQNKYAPVNPIKLMAWIGNTIASGYVVVAEENGRIIGSLGLGPHQFQWSDAWAVANEWLFVKPQYRKGGTAERLMQTAAMWCDSQKVPIIIGVQDIVDAEMKDRFLQIQGFEYGGGIFLRWPKDELSNKVQQQEHDED